jgi:hypothetical protein
LPLFFPASVAWAYRPFVSTDAAVADVKEAEIELGYFNLQREGRKNTFAVPSLVINYGLVQDLELVGEFAVEEPAHGTVRLADPALSLKGILKEGVLQEKDGVSVAVEAGLLLPATGKEDNRLGFQGLGVISGQLAALTYHLNLGGGVDRAQSHAFVVWGTIVELPIVEQLRLVGEVNGTSVKGNTADNSVLVGCIWNSPLPHFAVDAGVRKGISRGAADWMITAGLTFSFSPASYFHN